MREGKDDLPLEYIDIRDIGSGQLTGMMSALQFQHKLFLREMKGELLPPRIPLENVEVVLDFICGPGSWCVDFSKKYPEKQVYGVDISQAIIDHARENAAQSHAGNLRFLAIDRRSPVLPFPARHFDLIRLQNGTGFFTLAQWPRLMAELAGLLKPGGWLNLVDFEMGPASLPAVERLLALLGKILARMDRNTAPDDKFPITGSALGPHRMSQQLFTSIGYQLYPVDLGGWNNPVGRAYLAWSVVRPEMILYLAERTKISSPAELQVLLREVQRELRQIGFCGVGMLLSSFGRKPPDGI